MYSVAAAFFFLRFFLDAFLPSLFAGSKKTNQHVSDGGGVISLF